MGEALTGVAERRKSSPDMLWKLGKGGLDWIVMKSLEKNRTHRFGPKKTLDFTLAER